MEHQSFIDNACQCLKDIVKKSLDSITDLVLTDREIPIKRKTKDLKGGDVILPRYFQSGEEISLKVLENTREALKDTGLPVKSVSQDQHNLLCFYLDRPLVFSNVLTEVLAAGNKYGHCNKGHSQSIELRQFGEDNDNDNSTSTTNVSGCLTELRISYTLAHVKKLLEACGYTVNSNQDSSGHENNPVQDGVKDEAAQETNKLQRETIFLSLAKSLLEQQRKEGKTKEDGIVDVESLIHQQFSKSKGKGGFDKNLTQVEVFSSYGEATPVCKQAAAFQSSNGDECGPCLLIVPQNRVFKFQQAVALHTAVTGHPINQFYLAVGPTMTKGETVTVEQFERCRFNQMKETSEMRHGIKCEGGDWDHKISQLSQSGIKMEVFGTAMHSPLKIDGGSSNSAENRLGPFVLYNAARLATILRQFERQVENGSYPPLPPIPDINFSLLREEEDWELVYLYVAAFPSIVSECVQTVKPEPGKLTAMVHTHKITNFLVTFSKCLSSFYSRYHILGGSESHLLSLMYARLYLVRACHQVLTNALHLLDVQPLDEL